MGQDQPDQSLPPGIGKSASMDGRIRLGLAVLGVVGFLVLIIVLVAPI